MYIIFEGIEGSGKSVQIKKIENYLKNKNFSYIITKEPGSTDIGRDIRKILLNPENFSMSFLTEIFLYVADRAEHFDKVIRKYINSVDIIVSDRGIFSTLAYQGYARGINLDFLKMLNDFATGKLYPDYVILFDCPVEIALSRALKRESLNNSNESRFEQEHFDFHKKVRNGYLKLSEQYNNWFIVDSSKSIEEIYMELIKIFKRIGF